jgi:hypothetical protein
VRIECKLTIVKSKVTQARMSLLQRGYISADEPLSVLPYTTLSHYKGGEIQIKQLTKANLLLWAKGVEITGLSKPFKGAITITCRLAVRYLWVGSLCII